MTPAPHTHHATPNRRAFTLVELLVSLAIGAMLLVATAASLDASFRAYRVNETSADLTQRARLAMHRITQEIRAAQDHVPADTELTAFRAGANVSTLSVRLNRDASNGAEYTSVNDQLLRRTWTLTAGTWTPGPWRVFLDGIIPGTFSITMEPQRSPNAARAGLPYDQLRRATIRLTIRTTPGRTSAPTEMISDISTSLVSSAVPRRNAW